MVAGLLVGGSARAAPTDEHRHQSWLGLFAHGSLVRNLWIWTDIHLRGYQSFEPATFIVRPGLSWRATPNLTFTAGYGWMPSFVRAEGSTRWGDLDIVDEHRAWQQVWWTPSDPTTGLAAQLRGRIEQRFRPGEGEVGHRLRLFWRGQVPFTRDRAWLVIGWNEVFMALHDTQWGQRRGFDQNRAFVGVGWQVVPQTLRIELGYMNRWAVRSGPDPVDHILALNMFFGWGRFNPNPPRHDFEPR